MAAQPTLEELQATNQHPGVDLAGRDLRGFQFSGYNFTGANFTGANLVGANFQLAELSDANFRQAKLTDADFSESNLTDTDFFDANLQNVNFSSANLERTSLYGTYIEGVNFTDARLIDVEVTFAYDDDVTIEHEEHWNQNVNPIQDEQQAQQAQEAAIEVHIETRKNMEKLPELLAVLQTHLGTKNTSNYTNIFQYLEDTIGNYIQTNKAFNRNKTSYTTDFKAILQRLDQYKNTGLLKDTNKQLIGNIVDFVFQYKMEECYIRGLVYDCAHAYEVGTPGHETGMSCGQGIVERFVSTFKNCLFARETTNTSEVGAGAGSEQQSIFDKLRSVFGIQIASNTTRKKITNNQKQEYKRFFSKSLQDWTQAKQNNQTTQKMSSNEKTKAFTQYIKDKYKEGYGKNISPEVLRHFEDELIKEIQWDYFFFGGKRRKTRKSKKRQRKTRRH